MSNLGNTQPIKLRQLWLTLIKKNVKWVILAFMIFTLILFAYHKFSSVDDSPNYITAKVIRSDLDNKVMATGKVKAINTVNVGAQVSGEVTKLYVDVGDVIKKGDLIAQIDEVTQQNKLSNSQATLLQSKASLASAISALEGKQASLRTARANFKTAKANHIKAQADLKKAQTYLDRLKPLSKINAISKQDYDNSNTDVVSARAALATAAANIDSALANIASIEADLKGAKANVASQQANVKKSQTNVNTAQEDLGYTSIRAPIDGTVVTVTTKEGSTVNANQSAPTIVTLADLSRVRINAQISEADVLKVKAGLPVYFNTIGNPDDKIESTLAGIEPAPEKISNTSATNAAIYYIGYVEAPNSDGRFRIDMTAQIYIIINQAKNVLTIPSAALKEGNKKNNDKDRDIQGTHIVRVIKADGSIEDKAVTIGINNRVKAEVLSGLNEGDEIILSQGEENVKDDNNRRKPPM